MRVLIFFGFRHFGRQCCGLFSFEFKSFSNRIVFSMTVVIFLASGILENGSVAFFQMNLSVF